jgi:hypothetical protein
MAQVFISINVDAISLALNQPGGSWNAPINLGSYSQSDIYIEMMTQGSAVGNDQGGSELTVTANVGDQIIFTITGPGAGQNYYPVLYNTVLNNTNVKSFGPNTAVWTNYCLQSGGSGAQPFFGSVIPTGFPNAGQPNSFICAQWFFEVNAQGSTQYTMSFAILETQTGNVVGYYIWDPFITAKN